MYWTTMLLYGIRSGRMIQTIPTATGAMCSQWVPVREICMHFGVHEMIFPVDMCKGQIPHLPDKLWSASHLSSSSPRIAITVSTSCAIIRIFQHFFRLVVKCIYPDENPLGGEWPVGVPCTGGDAGAGTIDIDALEKLADFFSSKGHPIVVIFNYSTTFKGLCDDVKMAGEQLVAVLKKNDMYECTFADPENPSRYVVRKGFWFHVDGAISAAYMPFLEMAYKNGLTDIQPGPVFDFRLDFISSIVTSGHKFIGMPWPCGIYLVQETSRIRGWNIPYFASIDRTVGLEMVIVQSSCGPTSALILTMLKCPAFWAVYVSPNML